MWLKRVKETGGFQYRVSKKRFIFLSRVGAFCIERGRIPDGSVHAIERTGHQFDSHECLIRAGEGCSDAKIPGSGEPESRVISRMADHDHGTVPEMAAGIESFVEKGSTNTLALERRVNTQRGQCTGRNAFLCCIGRFDGDRREEHMPDDPVIMNSDKRKIRGKIPVIAQGIDEPGFAILRECIIVHGKNILDIDRGFRADKKRSHLFL